MEKELIFGIIEVPTPDKDTSAKFDSLNYKIISENFQIRMYPTKYGKEESEELSSNYISSDIKNWKVITI